MLPFQEQFKNKVIVVTGAGKGIGRALVQNLHSLQAKVYAVSRNKDDLNTLANQCPGIHVIQLDLTNWEQTRDVLMDQIPANVDILVNNAAVISSSSILDTTSDDFDRIMNTNVKALLHVTQICAKKMIAAGTEGTVLNVSSFFGIRPLPLIPVYSASKAAVDSLTKTMAVEFGKHKIQVLGFNPGFMKTNMITEFEGPEPAMAAFREEFTQRCPAGDMWVPIEQVMNTMLFLASGMARMMVGGAFTLDCGYLAT